MGASSSSSIEPGTTFAGFRVERALGGGRYEATQLALDRRVCLELRSAPWREPPRDAYAAGESEYGFYVAAPLAPKRRRRWPWPALVALLGLGAWLLTRGDAV